ncbi:unnamed protein product [Ophioblennius macclurei]
MMSRWSLLGLLCLCSLSFGQECDQQFLENIDFPGTDITSVYSPDVEHCQLMCTQHPSCLFFTFLRPEWTADNRRFYCYLKSTPTGTPKTRTPLLGVTSGFSLKSCLTNQQPCLSKVYPGFDFPGADYKFFFTADYEECQRACTQDPGCQFFTYVNELFAQEDIRYKCHLKFSPTLPTPPKIVRTSNLVSGFAFKTPPADPDCRTKLFRTTEIPGFDIREEKAASQEHCQAICSAHPVCTSFTFVSQTFQCFLKKNEGTLVMRASNGYTSGLPTRFCQPDNTWAQTSFRDMDMPGSDMRFEMVDDAETCHKICYEDPYCQFYTYATVDFHASHHWRRCYVKRTISIPAPPKITKLENVVSGFSRKNCDLV